MSEFVAVEGMTLSIVDGFSIVGGTPTPTTVEGKITITGSPSVINKNDGNGAYLDGLVISVTAITSPDGGATTPDPGPVIGNISATIEKVKENGTLLLVDGDETGTLEATPQIPSTPDPTDYPVTFKVRITDPNNNEVKAV